MPRACRHPGEKFTLVNERRDLRMNKLAEGFDIVLRIRGISPFRTNEYISGSLRLHANVCGTPG